MTIKVNKLPDDRTAKYVFKVTLDDKYEYKVWFSNDYYQKLTNGNVTEELLVKKSFEFLLKREGPESILSEFELSQISNYFPNYEKSIGTELSE